MNTLDAIKKASAKEVSSHFGVTINAGDAVSNYLMWLGWGESVRAATEAASDFIDTEEDVNGLEKVLEYIKGLSK
jgi:hypothetical protein